MNPFTENTLSDVSDASEFDGVPMGAADAAEATEAVEEADTTVGAVWESIEARLWMASAYSREGASGLALECLRGAWMEYVRFRDILRVYNGEDLGARLVKALVHQGGDLSGLLPEDAAFADEALRALIESANC